MSGAKHRKGCQSLGRSRGLCRRHLKLVLRHLELELLPGEPTPNIGKLGVVGGYLCRAGPVDVDLGATVANGAGLGRLRALRRQGGRRGVYPGSLGDEPLVHPNLCPEAIDVRLVLCEVRSAPAGGGEGHGPGSGAALGDESATCPASTPSYSLRDQPLSEVATEATAGAVLKLGWRYPSGQREHVTAGRCLARAELVAPPVEVGALCDVVEVGLVALIVVPDSVASLFASPWTDWLPVLLMVRSAAT